MSLAVVELYHRHLIQNCSNTPILKCHWFVPSHTKLLKLRAQTGSKRHKQRFLCDMSPAPVITVTRLVDLVN